MVKSLLPEGIPYYKANLHTHSVISDGILTPEQVKEEYKSRGYSVVALTDHDVIVDHQHLTDEDFIFITGSEICFEDTVNPYKCRHMCLLSKDPHLLWLPIMEPEMRPHSIPYFEAGQCEHMPRVYSPEAMNAAIKKANEKGFLVTLNHPMWSQEGYEDYSAAEGIWGLEYRNSACVGSGYDENNSWVYQQLLWQGKFCIPVMADDMHHIIKPTGAKELGQSWVMVAAREFTYSAIMDALEKGDLYSSCGPEIYSVRSDGDTVHITCSPAVRIQMMTQTRAAGCCAAAEGETLREGTFSLKFWRKRTADDPNGFVRFIVTAPDGSYAVTRAYTFDELELI